MSRRCRSSATAVLQRIFCAWTRTRRARQALRTRASQGMPSFGGSSGLSQTNDRHYGMPPHGGGAPRRRWHDLCWICRSSRRRGAPG
jgi:hypothetical protein